MTARLLRFDGRPSGAALLAVAACVAIAFTGAFVTRVSRGTTAPSTGAVVPESRLTGEVVAAQDRAAPPRLRKAASLPALAPAPVKPKRRAKKAKSRPRPAATAATPVRTPAATPEAEPVATAAPPVATAAPPVATAAPPVSPPASPPADTPSPAPTPGQTFDSSG